MKSKVQPVLAAVLLAVSVDVSLVGQTSPSWSPSFPVAAPQGRYLFGMAYDSQRAVTVSFGGWCGGFQGNAWEWDGGTWTQVATTVPAPRQSGAMTYDSQRGVCVLFGGTPGGNGVLADSWEWDRSSWTQLVTPGRGCWGCVDRGGEA